jgi:endonuclease V-like protein UPF0215 family
VIGFDDAPFRRQGQRQVRLVGAVYADLRLDGMLIGEVTRDGDDAAQCMAQLIEQSKFLEHLQLIMLQGIAVAGFNVVDVFHLHRRMGLPVLVIARNKPNLAAIASALTQNIPNGAEKWALIERLGPMEPAGPIFVQCVGLSLAQAVRVVEHFAVHSHIPEPIRTAHLFAGAIVNGQSRGCV